MSRMHFAYSRACARVDSMFPWSAAFLPCTCRCLDRWMDSMESKYELLIGACAYPGTQKSLVILEPKTYCFHFRGTMN